MSRTKPFSSAKVRQALADDVDAFVSGGGTVVECPPGEKRFKWRPVVFTGEGGAYIYFIQSGADGPIKIGYTNDIEARFSGLQIGNHETLSIVGFFYGPQTMEKALHRKFADDHIRGEWFKPTEDLMAVITATHQMYMSGRIVSSFDALKNWLLSRL